MNTVLNDAVYEMLNGKPLKARTTDYRPRTSVSRRGESQSGKLGLNHG